MEESNFFSNSSRRGSDGNTTTPGVANLASNQATDQGLGDSNSSRSPFVSQIAPSTLDEPSPRRPPQFTIGAGSLIPQYSGRTQLLANTSEQERFLESMLRGDVPTQSAASNINSGLLSPDERIRLLFNLQQRLVPHNNTFLSGLLQTPASALHSSISVQSSPSINDILLQSRNDHRLLQQVLLARRNSGDDLPMLLNQQDGINTQLGSQFGGSDQYLSRLLSGLHSHFPSLGQNDHLPIDSPAISLLRNPTRNTQLQLPQSSQLPGVESSLQSQSAFERKEIDVSGLLASHHGGHLGKQGQQSSSHSNQPLHHSRHESPTYHLYHLLRRSAQQRVDGQHGFQHEERNRGIAELLPAVLRQQNEARQRNAAHLNHHPQATQPTLEASKLYSRNTASSCSTWSEGQSAAAADAKPSTRIIPSPSSVSAAASASKSDKPSKREMLQKKAKPKPFQLTNRPPICLAITTDEATLSPYQCFLRKQIEAFETSAEHLRGKAQGRNTPAVVGQIGIQCKYCAKKPPADRISGSIFYSQTLSGIYQIAQNMCKTHFLKRCDSMPSSVRDQLRTLQQSLNRGSGGKDYWRKSASELGIIEDDGVLKFTSDVPSAVSRKRKGSDMKTKHRKLSRTGSTEGDGTFDLPATTRVFHAENEQSVDEDSTSSISSSSSVNNGEATTSKTKGEQKYATRANS